MKLILNGKSRKSEMTFWGNFGTLMLNVTGASDSYKVGLCPNGGERSFNGAELTSAIEKHYKFVEEFHLFYDENGKYFRDEEFLVWLEKYGEDKWFREDGGVKKAVARIRKEIKSLQSK